MSANIHTLNWSRIDTADQNLKLIVSTADFRALIGAIRPAGYYRGCDARGNSVTVRVVSEAA